MMNLPNPIDTAGVSASLLAGKASEVERQIQGGELKKASQEFEAFFLSYLMKMMRETVPKGALTANRLGEMFYSFYDEEIGKRAAQAGGIGLSEYILASIAENDTTGRASPGS